MDWTDVPKTFGLCAVDDCPVAASCLRSLGAQLLPEEYLQWFFVNPALTRRRTATEGCPAFADAAPQLMARGFTAALRQVPSGQMDAVREAIRAELGIGQNNFYEMRRGQRPLNRQEQARIAAVLVRFGAAEPVEFDAYEERRYWPF